MQLEGVARRLGERAALCVEGGVQRLDEIVHVAHRLVASEIGTIHLLARRLDVRHHRRVRRDEGDGVAILFEAAEVVVVDHVVEVGDHGATGGSGAKIEA